MATLKALGLEDGVILTCGGSDSIDLDGGKITGSSEPSSNSDLATKQYVDSSGGGGGDNRSFTWGFINLQTTVRTVSFALSSNLGGTSSNNYRSILIAPFNGTISTILMSIKGGVNSGSVVSMIIYKNADNFNNATTLNLNSSSFVVKTTGSPTVDVGTYSPNFSIAQGDVLQFQAVQDTGANRDSLVSIVLTES